MPHTRYFYGRRARAAYRNPTQRMEPRLYWASNFAPAPFVLDGVRWPTSEHYYQAAKFASTDPEWAEAIRKARTASDAARMGRNRQHTMVANWNSGERDAAMRRAVVAKFEQNAALRTALFETGDAILCEDAGSKDLYWGGGTIFVDGCNKLGRLLMDVRASLQVQD